MKEMVMFNNNVLTNLNNKLTEDITNLSSQLNEKTKIINNHSYKRSSDTGGWFKTKSKLQVFSPDIEDVKADLENKISQERQITTYQLHKKITKIKDCIKIIRPNVDLRLKKFITSAK